MSDNDVLSGYDVSGNDVQGRPTRELSGISA
jgi:hypothetical protein